MYTSSLAVMADGGDTFATSPTDGYRGIAEPFRHVGAWRDLQHNAHERFVIEIDQRNRVGIGIVDEKPGDATPIELHTGAVLEFTINPGPDHYDGGVLDVDAIEAQLGADGAIAVLIDRVIAGSELVRGADGLERELDADAREAADALDALLSHPRWFRDDWAVWDVGDWVEPTIEDALGVLGLCDLDTDPKQSHVDALRQLGLNEGVILGNRNDDICYFLEYIIVEKRVERIQQLDKQTTCLDDVLELLRLAETWAVIDRLDLRFLDDFGPDPRDADSRVPDEIVSWEWDGVSRTCRVIPNDGDKWRIEELGVVPDGDRESGED